MKTEKIKLSKDESKHLHNCLVHGKQKELAEYLGVKQPFLSRMLKPKDVYNVAERKFEKVVIIPNGYYQGVMRFINSITI